MPDTYVVIAMEGGHLAAVYLRDTEAQARGTALAYLDTVRDEDQEPVDWFDEREGSNREPDEDHVVYVVSLQDGVASGDDRIGEYILVLKDEEGSGA